MPKRKRREHQHKNQAPQRRRSFGSATLSAEERVKPPFPMNLFQNTKLFFAIGAVIMIGGVIAAAVLGSRNTSQTTTDFEPTPTATTSATASTTPDGSPTPTPVVKSFAKAEQVIDPAKNTYSATLKTNKGDIVLRLFADQSPNTVNSFVFLAKQGYFDGIIFHRIVNNFVIQGGDPTASGGGGPGYQTPDEPNVLPNKKYTLSMAKTAGATSFGSQFFINLKDNTSLDFNNGRGDKFYPWAEVSGGQDVVDAIGKAATDSRERPLDPIVIQSVTIEEKAK